MALALLCLAGTTWATPCATVTTNQTEMEEGLLLSILDQAAIEYQKLGMEVDTNTLLQRYKGGGLVINAITDGTGGNSFVVSLHSNPVIVTLGNIL